MTVPILEMRDILKDYPGVRAVDHASISLETGEVHALVGENGAGKTTLIKILAGVVPPDKGQIIMRGEPIIIHNGQDAQKFGLSFIHQELNLIPYMNAAENIFLGKPYPVTKLGLVDWKELRVRATDILAMLGIKVPMDVPVGNLTPGQQAMVSIGRAFAGEATIYVMDEPTASLTEQEIQNLFRVIASLQEKDRTVVYISHRLEEIFEIADSVTVMRDGKVVTTLDISGINTSDLIQYMIGRELKEAYPLSRSIIGRPLLSVENLTGDVVQDVYFTLQSGEILGIAGLVGAGRSEILRMLFGVDPVHDGSISVNGQEVKPGSPEEAISCGFALVPEERRTQGLITSRSVKENITLAHLNSFTSYGIFINQVQERRMSEKMSNAVQLRAHSQRQRVAQLSGGNQQKVVFAKWLLGDAQVLMLDEPTRGVDVGARFEIYNIIRDLAAEGTGILLVSSDLHELLGIADRLLVMRDGEMVTTLPVTADLSQETILTYYYGGDYDHSPKTHQ